MKIIKKGNPRRIKGVVRFECNHCGSVFEAERNEYTFRYHLNIKYRIVNCPCCKQEVLSIVL